MERKSVRAIVSGRVQGVWFRGWTVDQARALGLSGWVRNRTDGAVEAVFAGAPEAVDAMVRFCHRGPPMAKVIDVVTEPAEDPGSDVGFEQRPTV